MENNSFDNNCPKDGTAFDGDGICSRGHHREEVLPEVEKGAEQNFLPSYSNKCVNINGHCSICGCPFPEGDDVCDAGHKIGVSY
jgi:hypothetical protein